LGGPLGYEAQLWKAADALRSNMDAAEYKHIDVRAKLRVLVKRILRKHGYPPDKQEKATQTVLEQAEVLSAAWAA
jgi:type I restriction enzyme, R subunit